MRTLVKGVLGLVGVFVVVAVLVRILLGGGEPLEDRTSAPVLRGSALEKVVDLDYPPGNVAVFNRFNRSNPFAVVCAFASVQLVRFPFTSYPYVVVLVAGFG